MTLTLIELNEFYCH